jgi:hypothetical protein
MAGGISCCEVSGLIQIYAENIISVPLRCWTECFGCPRTEFLETALEVKSRTGISTILREEA